MRANKNVLSRAVAQSRIVAKCSHVYKDSPVWILGRIIRPQFIGEDYYIPCQSCGLLKRKVEVERDEKKEEED